MFQYNMNTFWTVYRIKWAVNQMIRIDNYTFLCITMHLRLTF